MPKAERDLEYLRWVKSLPCLVCWRSVEAFPSRQQSPTESHHYGPRAYGKKAPDRRAIPLCYEHHDVGFPESVHKLGKKFGEHHGIDVEAEIRRLNAEYDKNKEPSPVWTGGDWTEKDIWS